mgnify:CR=1 FL=1
MTAEQVRRVLENARPIDWHDAGLAWGNTSSWPEPLAAEAALDAAFAGLTAGAQAKPSLLEFKGRGLVVPLAARGVARFSFADLCAAPLGAGDYLEIARRFHTLPVWTVSRAHLSASPS